jgi:hypothetical protein
VQGGDAAVLKLDELSLKRLFTATQYTSIMGSMRPLATINVNDRNGATRSIMFSTE